MKHVNALSKNKSEKTQFLVDRECFQQTIDVIISRAEPLNIEIIVTDFKILILPMLLVVLSNIQINMDTSHQTMITNALYLMHNSNCKVIFASDLMCLSF